MSDTKEELLKIFIQVLDKEVKLEDNFEDLGGESIEMQDILGIVNQKYKLKIKFRDVVKLKYIDSIIDYIQSQVSL